MPNATLPTLEFVLRNYKNFNARVTRDAIAAYIRHLDAGGRMFWAMAGVLIGGRLGIVLFYQPSFYFSHPVNILRIWDGGMSFHGGMLGVTTALIWFTRSRKIRLFDVADLVACATPIGLFFGRIANFINDELWGRPTDVPWAMIFPRGGNIPRHPSQLYEAALEGILLLLIMQVALRFFRANERPGLMSAIFFLGYGTFRFIVEWFREPDSQFIGPISMGMALSIPIWIAAAALFWLAWHKPTKA